MPNNKKDSIKHTTTKATMVCNNNKSVFTTRLIIFFIIVVYSQLPPTPAAAAAATSTTQTRRARLANDNESLRKELLESCEFELAGIVTDVDEQPPEIVLEWTHRVFEWMPHFNTKYGDYPGLASWVRRAYTTNGNSRGRDFIVATRNPEMVLDTVDWAFSKESHGSLAGLPHKTRWFVIVWTALQLERVKGQQMHSSLDNVAVLKIKLDQEARHNHLMNVRHLWTFVWTTHRTRTPKSISFLDLGTRECSMFPNEKFGFNQRELRIVLKSFSKHFIRVEQDDKTGKRVFKGFLLNALQFVTSWLNCSYVFITSPEASLSISWEDFENTVSNGTADIGLSPYSSLRNVLQTNIEVSYPVFYERVFAIYKNSDQSSGTNFAQSNSKLSYILLVYIASGIGASALYVTIVYFLLPYIKEEVEEEVKKALECRRRQSNDNKSNRIRFQCTVFLPLFVRVLFIFLLSLINQSSFLPKPRSSSGRFVVAFWGLLIVALTSFFMSIYTATTIARAKPAPFSSFEDLVAAKQFSFVGFENSIIQLVINNSGSQLLKDIRQRTTFLSISESNQKDAVDITIKNLEDNVAFIYYELSLIKWQGEHKNTSNYVLVKDNLVQTSCGFVFAAGSEFTPLTNTGIQKFMDNGFVQEHLRGNRSECGVSCQSIHSNGGKGRLIFHSITFHTTLLVVSVVLLLSEIVYHRVVLKKKDVSLTRSTMEDTLHSTKNIELKSIRQLDPIDEVKTLENKDRIELESH